MATTTAAATITIAEDIRLDLGHTDLVGKLVFDGEDLSLVAPSGATQILGNRVYISEPGEPMQAPEGFVLIEEMGLARTLPAALVRTHHFLETRRYKGLSPWGADVVEILVIVPDDAPTTL